ncbi:uncharacterized protein LOC129229457 [Uloborus diversus]|uniref:uncharacterized protein LOC129229457 n=1 Tax=Uloborus diversus TaxID=327109 RepID=UPI002409C583|nr:uncharacterized protein LOC129229457 [Uloborus diversus]
MDCIDSAPGNGIDADPALITMVEDPLPTSSLCDDDTTLGKDGIEDLSNLDNLEILNSCSDNVFSNTNVMDCLSDINPSPETFDIPSMDNDDSALPIYGPYSEFESQSSFEWDAIDPHAVPGVCGLRNLGNTCFMNAGLQCLLNNKIFKNYFLDRDLETFVKGTLSFRFAEIMRKVWGGTFSTLHLGDFKECFGNMHAQFKNFRQHDCQEFLALLLDTMHEELNTANKASKPDQLTSIFNNCKDTVCETIKSKYDCEQKENHCDITDKVETETNQLAPMTSEESDLNSLCDGNMQSDTAAANNIKTNSNHSQKKDFAEAAIYERNTEKMADLLINNNKLDKILNKNELDVSLNLENENLCNHKLKAEKKNHILLLNDKDKKPEKNELADKLNAARKIPSIEDFVKDTKTLNTNVLVSDETNNLFKFDSEKFPKHESNRLQETVDNLGQIVDLGIKQGGIKRVKITNIIHEKHKILENGEQASSCSALHKRLKIENMDTSLDSPLNEQEDTSDMDQMPCDECSEGSSQSSELYALNSECRVILFAEEIRRAYNHWDQYKLLNQSIIVDTFHGQFRSSVVCSQCSHNSITYEPFMYLPIFLPHALERQIVITFVQNNGSSPMQYLVNINKFDHVNKIREALQRLLDVTTEDIIIAEVFENHISRILDENQSIRRVNDSTRSIYAFEVGKMCEMNSDASKSSNAIPLNFADTKKDVIALPSGCQFQEPNIFETWDSFGMKTSGTSVNKAQDVGVDLTGNSSSSFNSDLTNVQGPVQWHPCTICLEDLPEYNLSCHPNCECILCSNCIEVSCKHYGGDKFLCPVCGSNVSSTEDFVPLSQMGDYQFRISTIPIPIVIRHDTFEDETLKEKLLIGHPGLLKLPSILPAAKLYELVDNAIPFLSTYSLLLVDGQGKNCSRCLYSEHCSGCEIARLGEIKLQHGDSIAVRYIDLPPESIASASFVAEHKSMQQARHKSDLDIYSCLEYFSERESLDEDSPWFCPVCRRNQQATKSLSIWKFPEVLIIYLKRFVFHDFVSMKVEDKVSYPLEGLDLSSFSTGPFSGELIYDLQACVCHFGGVSAGHYTSFSKHALTNEWYYYNDENVKKEAPNTEECVNEYILFYQRR